MRTIGLLGGMSFESSAVYYKHINEAVRSRLGGLHSAELLLYSLDFQEIVDLQRADRWDEAADRLATGALRLQSAGAECILICTNTMHLVAGAVQSSLSVPLLDIINATAHCLKESHAKRPLLLATKYTMEHGFYADRMRQNGLDLMLPDAAGRALVHKIIFDELCAGEVREASRQNLIDIVQQARQQGADSVILGCTELVLLLDPFALPLPGFDSTAIHCKAAVAFALAD